MRNSSMAISAMTTNARFFRTTVTSVDSADLAACPTAFCACRLALRPALAFRYSLRMARLWFAREMGLLPLALAWEAACSCDCK